MSEIAASLGDRLHSLRTDFTAARQRHRYLVPLVITGFLVAAIVPTAFSGWVFAISRHLPGGDAVRQIGEMDQATTIYDRRDQPAFTVFREQRIEVPLAEISPNVVHALVAIEDQRFYDHNGFDGVRTVSAAMANFRQRRAVQGGSTITQQLARQNFLKPDKTIGRKLQELLLAGRIEAAFSKQKILELYLNKVYFGDGLYGIEAASRGYFAKRASELTVAEAALLAGIVKAPSSYSPNTNLERATARRNIVLQAMLDAGAIDRATWQDARASKISLSRGALAPSEPHGQYFKEQVRQELFDRFGSERVYRGGLRVFTTYDLTMQQAAETAVRDQLSSIEERRRTIFAKRAKAPVNQQPLQAALVALDPMTGHVFAMVGGRDFKESRFNRAVQAHRQPGSAFKPFVYAAALESGYSPATMLTNLDDPVATSTGSWTPEDEHSSASSMTLRTGLRTSSNRAAVKLLRQIGIGRAVEYAKNMGVGDVPSVPSLALGSGEVTVQAMTAAYSAFANHGLVPKPMLIRRVEDRDGRVLFSEQPSTSRAISDTTAFLMTNMLADVINAGTGARARRLGFTLPAAGKTGTTNDFNDAWFVGFTPRLATGVWVGFDQPHTILPNGFAAEVAVPLWAKFMKAATDGNTPEWYSPPAGVVALSVCRLSGKLATEDCVGEETIDANGNTVRRPSVYTEYFVAGTQPTTYCDAHSSSPGFFGRIASVFTGSAERPAAPPPPDPPSPPVVRTTTAPPPPPPHPTTAMPDSTLGTSIGTALGTVGQTDKPHLQRKSKRGFWSRLFKGSDDPTTTDVDPPRKKSR